MDKNCGIFNIFKTKHFKGIKPAEWMVFSDCNNLYNFCVRVGRRGGGGEIAKLSFNFNFNFNLVGS